VVVRKPGGVLMSLVQYSSIAVGAAAFCFLSVFIKHSRTINRRGFPRKLYTNQGWLFSNGFASSTPSPIMPGAKEKSSATRRSFEPRDK